MRYNPGELTRAGAIMDILQPPLKIVKYPHPSLRYKAAALTHVDETIRSAARAMIELMYSHKGLGLAGPQVGLPYRLFVVNYAGDPAQKEAEAAYLNPVILEKKGGTVEAEEGCLSFPELFQK